MAETKKELGQHWLKDESVLQAIVEAGEVRPDDFVLEIGPGQGTLTRKLVETGAQILALEFDQDLIPGLRAMTAHYKNLAVSVGDIRTFDLTQLPVGYKVIANIPYYLTSHLIRSLSESTNPPSHAVLLIQKEVAERLCGGPGSMSILAVTAQFYFECSLDIEVPAHFFTPPPKVDSRVVMLRRREKKLFDVDEKSFFRLVKAGFSEKRKTLRNALSGGLAVSKVEAEAMLKKAEIDPSLRAQALTLHEWYRLYVAVLQ